MNEHADYFDRVFQIPPVICGRQLKCLSLGRYRLMAWFGVAFTAEQERPATAGDLLMGVLIASMTVKDFEVFVAQPDFKQQVQKWGRRAGFFPPRCFGWPLIGKWLERTFGEPIADADFEELTRQINEFQTYIKESSRSPEYWDENQDGKPSAAHWSESLEVVLSGNLGWSDEAINEQPLGRALALYFKHMENLGLVTLMTKAEADELNTPLTPEQAAEANECARKVKEFFAAQAARGEVACG
jgi:hypothetical protein